MMQAVSKMHQASVLYCTLFGYQLYVKYTDVRWVLDLCEDCIISNMYVECVKIILIQIYMLLCNN